MATGTSRQALPCRQPHMERVGLRRRWLLASTAIGVAGCLALSQLVYANDECGAIVGNAVTCTSAGNNYTGGISYDPTDDLTMVVQDGVTDYTPSSGNRWDQYHFPCRQSVRPRSQALRQRHGDGHHDLGSGCRRNLYRPRQRRQRSSIKPISHLEMTTASRFVVPAQ